MGERIAFLTSGGDSQGMNAAIRAIVRMAIYRGCEAFAILEGFRGLVQGGSMIIPYKWNDVAHIIGEGGTVIKSSRCPEFRERRWRKVAAKNLVMLGIDKLIVIGGDGSLTGADTFRQEWPSLLQELVEEDEIEGPVAMKYEHLMIVGLVGSIDNDMSGTEITIGANSSLHRIIEAVDCIHSTASSHQRAFVIEVMGRHCGWLALNAAISCGADWLLLPEDPPAEGWEEVMCRSLARQRAMGRSVSIVIVAEGAIDRKNVPIKSEYVKEMLIASGLDARVTTLGHIQRGGNPSAYDRYLGTMQGIKAVQSVLDSDAAKTPSLMVGMNENRITCRPLLECVTKTRSGAMALENLDFKKALELRDPDFKANLAMWQMMHHAVDTPKSQSSGDNIVRVGIMNCGAPCGGMNASVAASFLYAASRGFKIVGIFNGFDGLSQGDYRELRTNEIFGTIGKGGSLLGTNRSLPESLGVKLISERIQEMKINALIIVGGFEAYSSILQLIKSSVRMPMVLIPATISNNVPGTEYSIGSDTALNVIVQNCDYIRQSASSSRKRVFVVDVQGGNCGYLATMAALSTGASRAYIPEEGLHLADLRRDAQHLSQRFADDRRQGRLIIRNERCSKTYSAELISKILEEESGGMYDSRWVVLGHLQQGGSPSPLDRVRAVRLTVLAMNYIESLLYPSAVGTLSKDFERISTGGCVLQNSSTLDIPIMDGDASSCDEDSNESLFPNAIVIGIRGSHIRYTSALSLEPATEMSLRRPKHQWWMNLTKYSHILAKYPESPADDLFDSPLLAPTNN